MLIFLLWTWSKLEKFDFLQNLPLMFWNWWNILVGVGDDRVCSIFIYNAVIWWVFCGVILSYPLTNLYLCGDISVSVVACTTIIVLQFHIVSLLFSRWWKGVQDWYVFIGWLLLIDLKNCLPSRNSKPNLKLSASIEWKSSKIRKHNE